MCASANRDFYDQRYLPWSEWTEAVGRDLLDVFFCDFCVCPPLSAEWYVDCWTIPDEQMQKCWLYPNPFDSTPVQINIILTVC